uniref:Uncharacterized protein n=1 Tax=Anguilla anguilla TaxID=7936 RepID=A0A0E9VZL9_ANGAN
MSVRLCSHMIFVDLIFMPTTFIFGTNCTHFVFFAFCIVTMN